MLAIDASQLNIHLIEDLEYLFEANRYILTVRRPLSWLRSFVDDSLRRDVTDIVMRYRRYRFGAPDGHAPAERVLADHGLHTVSGYLRFWQCAVEFVLAVAPPERLIIVETDQIANRVGEIARFVGLDDIAPHLSAPHAHANYQRSGVVERIDRDFLIEQCEEICGDTARLVMPGWSAAAEMARIAGGLPIR
ncbi:hypothetical protein [Oricola sp.]|uniref:hypothetical protein n=1 Tax=Oricola sp. TaxID=1979950 RepID=UPI003BA8E87A